MDKILIIEDQIEIRENLEEYLELCNFQVRTAPNGRVGLELMNQETPDLIICDVAMPVMDGYEVLQRVRANPSTVNVPFVFLSASAQEKDIAKGIQAGSNGYFTKPIATDELERAIRELLKPSKD